MARSIDAEILAKATRLGYRIGQVGVHHYPRTAGTQTGAKLSVILRAFKELFKLRKDILAVEKNGAIKILPVIPPPVAAPDE